MVKIMISIIVPVYNVENYLGKCLDSLINQTYKDIEIICINDGSTDNSLNILREYEQIDSRIIIIDQKNGGLSDARNIGLKEAAGEYIMFVDSDDWIDLETCQKALEAMLKYSTDIVMWSYIREYENKSLPKSIFDNNIYFDKKDTVNKIYRRLFGLYKEELSQPENADALVTVWGKLYKSELILKNNIRFIDTKKIGTCEDALFNMEVFKNVKSSYFINSCFYHYRKINTSVTSRYREDLYIKWDNLYELMNEQIEDNDLGLIFNEALSNRIALNMIDLGLNVTYSNKNTRDNCYELKKILKNSKVSKAVKNMDLQYFPIHWKIFFYFIKRNRIFPVYMMLIIMNKLRGII